MSRVRCGKLCPAPSRTEPLCTRAPWNSAWAPGRTPMPLSPPRPRLLQSREGPTPQTQGLGLRLGQKMEPVNWEGGTPLSEMERRIWLIFPSLNYPGDPMGSASRMAIARGTQGPAAWERPAGSLPSLHSSLPRSQDTGALQRGCPRDPTRHPKG